MSLLRMPQVLGALALAASAAASAGTATVSFTDADSYADAGTTRREEPGNLHSLARHIEQLAQQRLPAEQSLRVEVLDVDLAGSVRPSRRDGTSLRIVRGMADFPRMHMRWTLRSGNAVLASGDEWVQDLDYTSTPLIGTAYNDPLRYEKRMLARWFDERFGARAAASR